MRAETAPWWRQTRADLESALWNARGERWYAVSWFAQQAAEKAVKALWLERRGELPPRTHALQFLGRDLGVPDTVQADLDLLAPVFSQVRYPEPASAPPVDAIGPEDARVHLTAAERVLNWVGEELGL